jgi:hypothetical protein
MLPLIVIFDYPIIIIVEELIKEFSTILIVYKLNKTNDNLLLSIMSVKFINCPE